MFLCSGRRVVSQQKLQFCFSNRNPNFSSTNDSMEPLYSDTTGHKNNVDFTRFALAVFVVFTHSYFVFYGPVIFFQKEPLWLLTNHQLTFGTLAVNFFFIISGFLVLQSLLRSKNYFSFLKKRVLRIYPAFIVVYFFCAFIVAPLGNGTPSHPFQNFSSYWSQINVGYLVHTCIYLKSPLLPETFKTVLCPYELNTSIWTIPFEFSCYIILLCLGILGAFKWHKLIPLALFLLVLSLNIVHYNIYMTYNENLPLNYSIIPYIKPDYLENFLNMEHLLIFFLSGSCFYYYRKYIPRSINLVILSIILLIISAKWIKIFELVQGVFGAYVMFYFIFSKRVKLHNFARFGDFSYGIYLFGWPVQQLIIMYFGDKLNLFGSLFISLAIIILFAFSSWHVVEKPALSLKNKSLDFGLYRRIKMLWTKD